MSEEHPVVGGDPLLGTVLADRYRIERKLGEGGMGAVYLARHVILEKIVALKILHDEYARRRELVERFLHEAKAASRIRHEHVIDITDFGETASKNVFFAMEYLEGHDLASELDRGPMEWPRIKRIMLQLCAALQAAHEAGIIHRDLKPENIYLVERLGNPDFVKVLDFGVAKLTDPSGLGVEEPRERRLTRTGMVFGTPEYMSPEQARGEKPDIRVDVYATGCILFELVTGDVPFRGDNFMGVLTKHLFDPLPRLAERTDRTDYPPGLQEVVTQALAKDKEQRFASMNELAVAIDTLDTTAGVSYSAASAERSRRAASSNPLPVPPPRAASSGRPIVPAAPVLPTSDEDRTGPTARARTAPFISEDERTIPRLPAATPVAGDDLTVDDDLATPRRSLRGLVITAAGIAVLAVGALVWVATRPGPQPTTSAEPLPTSVPAPPASEPAPAAAPEPAPAPAATLPDAAPTVEVVPGPAQAPEPEPEPEAPPVVTPPPAAAAEPPEPPREEKKPSRRPKRERPPRHAPAPQPEPRPASETRPQPAATPPAPPPDSTELPASDLKDPFRRK
jgi:serine/threonine-protein kinase